MLKEDYRSINVREGDEDYVAENYAMFGFRLVNKETVVFSDERSHRDFVLYSRNGPFYVEKPIYSSIVRYSKLTFSRPLSNPNYAFEKAWGDVYENLRKDGAYLAISAHNEEGKARRSFSLIFLFLVLLIGPVVALVLLYHKGGIFDLSATGAYGAWVLMAIALFALLAIAIDVGTALYHRLVASSVKKDLVRISTIERDFIRAMRTGNSRPSFPFSKVMEIEARYRR